ncbi:cation diffusion facilitator family transporter [Sphingomonas sp.]|uniref:cation diffusion facilitator family transporter n=1 Tax=Sphingomonas sp. TaxID=28214 RepID=UPI00286C4146|nr:cation diffusion facilitator family transporter [Sphingomonas sp.]
MSGSQHDHGHGHNHAPAEFGSAFLLGIVLNLGYVAVEAVFGFWAGSVALIADAGHNLSDVLGLAIAWGGAVLIKRKPSPRFSYGLKKSSILAALINALILLVAIGAIAAEAVQRLVSPRSSDGMTVMIVAALGIIINGVTSWLFARGRHHDINIRGVFLHMASDAAVSAAVVIAGALILWTGAMWIDPIVSLIVVAVILWGTWGLLTEAAVLTLSGVPNGIDAGLVEQALARLPGVVEAHHLHIWPLSTTETAMTVHLVVASGRDRDSVLRQANAYAHEMFGIAHSTIQVEETGPGECAGAH